MSKKKILIARCDHETDVLYPFHWAEVVKEEISKRNSTLRLLELGNEDFVTEKFENLVKSENPSFIFCSGHGQIGKGGYCIKGHNNENVIIACKNDIIFRGKIVYALVCNTINCLKESAMAKGCHCYIGYDGKFSFRYTKKNLKEKDILNDEVAKAFMETSNSIPLTLINGGTLDEAYKNFNTISQRWIDHWGDRFLRIVQSNIPLDVIEDIIGFLRRNRGILRINYRANENLLYSK